MALTPKQQLFCDEYLIDLNATQAAIRAGYSAKTAYSIGERLLRNVEILKILQELKKERHERTKINADYVLQRLAQIDEMDVADILNDDGSLRPVKEWPKVWRQYISGFEISEMFDGRGDERHMVGLLKKIKWPDKLKNLELLGKHSHVGAFSEQIKHQFVTENGEPITGIRITVRAVSPGEREFKR
jgi:phage terminase small subunit